MLNKQLIYSDAMKIAKNRPLADHAIEQFQMTAESMAQQVVQVREHLSGKTVLFIGDDDHMSVLFAKYLGVKPVVFEYDERVIESLKRQYGKNGISDYFVEKYDVRNSLPEGVYAEAFYVNPPYSSKNKGLGVKAWLLRAAQAVPMGSVSVAVVPLSDHLTWTMTNLVEIISFGAEIGIYLCGVDRDLHAYHNVNDEGLLSADVYFKKIHEANNIELGDISGNKLYR
jgi:predicted methyltransferase